MVPNIMNPFRYSSGGGSVAGWKELARTTLGSNADEITVSSLDNKRYYMILTHITDTGQANNKFRMGYSSIDDSLNYAYRNAANGGTDGPSSNTNSIHFTQDPADDDKFSVSYISNLSGQEKILINNTVERGDNSGAGNAPSRIECVGKWVNTSNPLDVVRHFNTASGSYTTGTECVVLGYDESDSHTDDFWEELASVTTGSAGSTLQSGTITGKKYLWIQATYKNDSAADINALPRFNGDAGSNYTTRYFVNNGTSTSARTNRTWLDIESGSQRQKFCNMFIINNASTEKLCIFNQMDFGSSGSANAPNTWDGVAKWTNTSDQITSIEWDQRDAGNYAAGAELRVWGSD